MIAHNNCDPRVEIALEQSVPQCVCGVEPTRPLKGGVKDGTMVWDFGGRMDENVLVCLSACLYMHLF